MTGQENQERRKQSAVYIPQIIFGLYHGSTVVPVPEKLSPKTCAWCLLVELFETKGETVLSETPSGELCKTHAIWAKDPKNFEVKPKRVSDHK